ncbi:MULTISPECIES: hypothetical protein [unclassified Bradyrhizobium]|uniref:hypothetical protein n=1 Tax=unclassified Bradyrhizobium TaxID=2631580 RepID=UPI00291684B9|nr:MULTISPECIES: hypothetical protein [unclassified Bradyrhizobium]
MADEQACFPIDTFRRRSGVRSGARKDEIRSRDQADLGCPDAERKIFDFAFSEIHGLFSASRFTDEGRFANVTMRWVGCGGRDGAQHALGMPTYATSRTVKSQGPGLPKLRSAQRVKRVVATVANKPVTEETAYKS